jgi:hypothetical protein
MNDVRQLNWIKAKMILPNDCIDVDWSDVSPQRAAKAARCPTKAEDGRKPHEPSRLWLSIERNDRFLKWRAGSANRHFGLDQFGPGLCQPLPRNGIPSSNCERPFWVDLVRLDDAALTKVKDTILNYADIRTWLEAVI